MPRSGETLLLTDVKIFRVIESHTHEVICTRVIITRVEAVAFSAACAPWLRENERSILNMHATEYVALIHAKPCGTRYFDVPAFSWYSKIWLNTLCCFYRAMQSPPSFIRITFITWIIIRGSFAFSRCTYDSRASMWRPWIFWPSIIHSWARYNLIHTNFGFDQFQISPFQMIVAVTMYIDILIQFQMSEDSAAAINNTLL